MKRTFRERVQAALGVLTFLAVSTLVVVVIVVETGAQTNAAAAAVPTPTLRFATWNVRDCAATDPASGERLSFHDDIARAIRDARVDIIALQEIQADSANGGTSRFFR